MQRRYIFNGHYVYQCKYTGSPSIPYGNYFILRYASCVPAFFFITYISILSKMWRKPTRLSIKSPSKEKALILTAFPQSLRKVSKSLTSAFHLSLIFQSTLQQAEAQVCTQLFTLPCKYGIVAYSWNVHFQTARGSDSKGLRINSFSPLKCFSLQK